MNNKCKFLIVLTLVFLVANMNVQAEKFKGTVVVKNTPKGSTDCFPPAKNTELALNNVRAYLKSNGTMWFSENAEYEVPKGSGKTSMFSSALWIGGEDAYKQLYVAAMRFGQNGNDYWTGPLKLRDGSIDPGSCSYYDNFYRMTRIEVERHIAGYDQPGYEPPKSILDWPANPRHSNTGESQFLAPFCKVGGGDPNVYEPRSGDYPYYDLQNELCPWTEANKERAKIYPWLNKDSLPDENGKFPNPGALPLTPERIWTKQSKEYGWDNKMIFADHVLKGDETVFWFLNDAGGIHTESKSDRRIGLEIRVQAFAFATNDELNKMTFYSYEIINRGTNTLSNTFFSQWVDPDLGYAFDDFVGCDVNRGLGYCYNGTEIDGSGEPFAYGVNPPAVGVDFFQGPYIDADDADNPKFEKELADIIQGTDNQKEYCKRFVHYIVSKGEGLFNSEDPNLYDKSFEKTIKGFKEPQILRWNDQFAINGVNFGDGIVDNERFGMRRFVYHDNDDSPRGDPSIALEYYRMLRGIWKDNTPMTYGLNAYKAGGPECDFMFPGGTDYCNWGTRGEEPDESKFLRGGKRGTWTEKTPDGVGSEQNKPYDRRFMHSAGPFKLKQGACNYITVGIPWARATQGGTSASIALLFVADDKCQALFENCFKIIDGPDAPILTIREYDQKLIFLLSNDPKGNNANEDYKEADEVNIPKFRIDIVEKRKIIKGDTVVISTRTDSIKNDRYYRFEGYQIYQVVGPEVGANDLENPDLARLIRQFDIVNYDSAGSPIGTLINWEFDEEMMLAVPKIKVVGANTGIQHSFEVTQDVFATDNKRLVNYKNYYFIAVAYAYNDWYHYTVDINAERPLVGQQRPYLRGRKTGPSLGGKSVSPIMGTPHPSSLHGGGTTLNCDYGAIPNIVRIDGQGNGGVALELTQETIDKIVNGGDKGDYRVRELKYEKNAGPLQVKVIDPLRVQPFDYTLYIKDSLMNNPNADVTKNSWWEFYIDETVSDDELRKLQLVDDEGNAIRKFSPIYYVNKHNSPSSKKDSAVIRKIGDYFEYIIFPLGISVAVQNQDFSTKQSKVIEKWQSRILAGWNNPSQVGYVPDLVNREYKAKFNYCQPEKIDISEDIVFAKKGARWITGLKNDKGGLPSHWIRAGNYNLGTWQTYNSATITQVSKDYTLWRLEDAFFPSNRLLEPNKYGKADKDRAFKDYSGKFATLCEGTWAPYVLTSPYDGGPQAKYIFPEPRCDEYGRSIYVYDKTDKDSLHPMLQEPKEPYYAFQEMQNFPPNFQPGYNQTMTNLYSVNVVLTPNQDLWTRCIVLEACSDRTKSIGGALKNEPRRSKSVGKNGKPDNSTDGFGVKGDEGMGWFPGYAINIETGERLNIMFAENSDSTLAKYGSLVNGTDMIFNPTSVYALATKDTLVTLYFGGYEIHTYLYEGMTIDQGFYNQMFNENDNFSGYLRSIGIERIWGGMHYVYVCGSSGNTSPAPSYDRSYPEEFTKYPRRNFNHENKTFTVGTFTPQQGGFLDAEKKFPFFDLGPYDRCEWLVQKFKKVVDKGFGMEVKRFKTQLFNNVMYTYIPMKPSTRELEAEWLKSDVTFKIRVTRPYLRYISRWYESPEKRDLDYTVPEQYNNNGFPVYKLSTKELAPTFNDPRLYQSILDKINIVPNPYYGGSFYEKNALDTKVKITNLPTGLDLDTPLETQKKVLGLKNDAKITINIFTVSGILVRTLTKGDNQTTFVEWDLKNYANIPVAGGVYIIHVNCPGIGERMLKFFCTMRPTDLNNF